MFSELVKRIEIKRVTKSFGQLLCLASIYPSDNDNQLCPIKSCGHPERSVNVLTNLPDLISIAIDWHSFQCSTTDVEDLLSKMDPLIHLREVNDDLCLEIDKNLCIPFVLSFDVSSYFTT